MAAFENQAEFAGEVAWKLWYQDTFDRECPRQVEMVGRGLLEGLIELWARHLSETVQADGGAGFSRFDLWLQEEMKSIVIVGDWDGLVRLRKWMMEDGRVVLRQITRAHRDLIQKGDTSEKIVAAAKGARNREDFEQRLIDF